MNMDYFQTKKRNTHFSLSSSIPSTSFLPRMTRRRSRASSTHLFPWIELYKLLFTYPSSILCPYYGHNPPEHLTIAKQTSARPRGRSNFLITIKKKSEQKFAKRLIIQDTHDDSANKLQKIRTTHSNCWFCCVWGTNCTLLIFKKKINFHLCIEKPIDFWS